MTGTPRKTAPRKAQPAKVAPSVVPEDDDSFDLASIFAKHGDPEPVKLFGVKGHVLKEYTGEQVIEFSTLLAQQKFGPMLGLITDVGEELWAKIAPLHPTHAAEIMNVIVEKSGLHEGKLFAPSTGSVPAPAGAQPSQDSNTATS